MLTGLLFGAMLAVSPASGQCTAVEMAAGLCSVTNTGTTVDIGATRPGRSDDARAGHDGDSGSARPLEDSGGDATRPVAPGCGGLRGEGCYTVEVMRQPTLNDLVSFAPAPLALLDEPGGVGLVGLPVNFVVGIRTHEQSGVLFDRAVTVRFTPDTVVFAYGDGTTRATADGGSTWGALGLPAFGATETSHAYRTRGSYVASASVRYTAAVDFGGGWRSVPGTLDIATGSTTVEVFEVRTALVADTCLEAPAAPGC